MHVKERSTYVFQGGSTALIEATWQNHVEIVQLLVSAGVDINYRNHVSGIWPDNSSSN